LIHQTNSIAIQTKSLEGITEQEIIGENEIIKEEHGNYLEKTTSPILIHQTNSTAIQTEPPKGIASHQTASMSTNLLSTFSK